MNNTPRTEAVVKMAVGPMREYAIIKHAQTLERELLKAQAERDEARAESAKLRNIVETAINYLDQSYRDGFADEVSDLRYELEQLKEAAK
jgi:hypothetical protein